MGTEDRIRELAASYLRPGEMVQVVFMASSSGPGGWGGSANRAVVVTSQRIVVLAVHGIRPKALEVIAELPRSTPLGPAQLPGPYLLNVVNDEPLWVPREFFKDIEQADWLRPGPQAPMPAAGRAGPAEDHSAHAAGRVCKRCRKPIGPGQPARLRGESDWVHDTCPA